MDSTQISLNVATHMKDFEDKLEKEIHTQRQQLVQT
jgi:hypothetical protein